MMKRISAKLKSSSGASIVLVLALLLICIMISSVIIVAATSGASRNVNRSKQQQGYLSITSAVELVVDEMESSGKFVGKAEVVDYGCNFEGLKQYTPTYDGESMLAEETPCEDITETSGVDIWNVDAENTALGSVFATVLSDACTEIYDAKQTSYTTTFTIESGDTRLMDVDCEFLMDNSYNITINFTAADTSYAMTLKFTGTSSIGTEPIPISCTHGITYNKVNVDGSLEPNHTGTIEPVGEKTIIRTTVTWGLPSITKGVETYVVE